MGSLNICISRKSGRQMIHTQSYIDIHTKHLEIKQKYCSTHNAIWFSSKFSEHTSEINSLVSPTPLVLLWFFRCFQYKELLTYSRAIPELWLRHFIIDVVAKQTQGWINVGIFFSTRARLRRPFSQRGSSEFPFASCPVLLVLGFRLGSIAGTCTFDPVIVCKGRVSSK